MIHEDSYNFSAVHKWGALASDSVHFRPFGCSSSSLTRADSLTFTIQLLPLKSNVGVRLFLEDETAIRFGARRMTKDRSITRVGFD
jgi:hypothetical protein